jgi:hypothetical protein
MLPRLYVLSTGGECCEPACAFALSNPVPLWSFWFSCTSIPRVGYHDTYEASNELPMEGSTLPHCASLPPRRCCPLHASFSFLYATKALLNPLHPLSPPMLRIPQLRRAPHRRLSRQLTQPAPLLPMLHKAPRPPIMVLAHSHGHLHRALRRRMRVHRRRSRFPLFYHMAVIPRMVAVRRKIRRWSSHARALVRVWRLLQHLRGGLVRGRF